MSKVVIGLEDIKALIPHRDPMLFVHSVEIDVSGGTKKGLQARAILPPETIEFWLQGPERAFPSVFAVEVFAQVIGVAFLCANPEYRGKLGGLLAMEDVIFSPAPSQGLQINSTTSVISANGAFFKSRGQMYCGHQLIAKGDFLCGLLQ
jgi:3-hydroxymyristoyl/3-hydroxydecanoyl-(acyl carrier protein) dehydratase